MTRMLATLLWFLMSLPSLAQMPSDVVEGQLLTGWRESDGRHVAAIRLRLEPGWKTYWRVPGDAGIPPTFDFAGSGNLAAAQPHWPVPEVFWQGGMRSIGYSDVVTIPLVIRPGGPGPIDLAARMEIGVCQDICLPVTLEMAAVLPDGAGFGRRSISMALADRPEVAPGGLTCRIAPISDGLRLTVSADLPALGPREEAVIELPDSTIWVSEPDTTRSGNMLVAAADLVAPSGQPFALSRDGIRLTVFSGRRATEIEGCVTR